MLSQNIEIENVENKLDDINKEINAIQNEINESNKKLRLKTLELEKKQNLRIALERKLNELKEKKQDYNYSSYMNSYKVGEIDKKYENNNQVINNNTEQIDNINNQINNSKNFFTKTDLKIQREKLKFYNKFLGGKNIFLESKQRMHLVVSRNINKMINSPQNFVVSVNNINLKKVQEKYENKVERTYELETHMKELQQEGHKIRSKFFGKAVEFYTKRDNKTRDKYQKLLQTQSEFLKLESARQFYADDYKLTVNQEKVLAGDSLDFNDINIERELNRIKQEENVVEQIKGQEIIEPEEIEAVVEQNSKNDEQKNQTNDVIKVPKNEQEYLELIEPILEKYDIEFEYNENNRLGIFHGVHTIKVYGGTHIDKVRKQLEICAKLGIQANAIHNGVELNNLDSFKNKNEVNNASNLEEIKIPEKKTIEEPVNTNLNQNENIIKFPVKYNENYYALISENLAKNNISFVNYGTAINDLNAIYTLNINNYSNIKEIERQLEICANLGIKVNAIINGEKINNFVDELENEINRVRA